MIYSHVLVPTDGSNLDEQILPFIEAIVRNGLAQRITFLRVIEALSIPPMYISTSGRYIDLDTSLLEGIISEKIAEAANSLKKLVNSLCGSNVEIDQKVMPAGGVAESIVQYAKRNGIDFIIMASHGRTGIRRWFWGSIAHQVLRLAQVPVFVLNISNQKACS